MSTSNDRVQSVRYWQLMLALSRSSQQPPAADNPEPGAPPGEDDGLRADVGLPRDAGDVREVGAPLPAVQAVAPPLAHAHSLGAAAAAAGR